MKEFIEGSAAIARTIKMCRPGVISAYPITPQTHIGENLVQYIADGEMECEFVNSESEHSSASIILGVSAVGVRAYNSTSSQGLLLMAEVLYSIAGMRFPLVITCANRAVSSPINIWNDHQDSVTLRDSGWIQFYAENNQEACDLLSMGVLGGPDSYTETRYAINETMREVLELIPEVATEFKEAFGRGSGGLLQEYKTEDADRVIVAMGSVVGTVKAVIDEMRAEGKKVGLLKVVTHRPLPSQALYDSLKHVPEIAVLDKSISLGAAGPLYMDLKYVFQGKDANPKINGFIAGLGGRDITKDSIREIFDGLSGEQVDHQFIGLDVEHVMNVT
jgi:pyruvate ferredoxin oxidoreductase alpha subunit